MSLPRDADGKEVGVGDRMAYTGTVERTMGGRVQIRWDRQPAGHETEIVGMVIARCGEKVREESE